MGAKERGKRDCFKWAAGWCIWPTQPHHFVRRFHETATGCYRPKVL
jgi:hypothetical protein